MFNLPNTGIVLTAIKNTPTLAFLAFVSLSPNTLAADVTLSNPTMTSPVISDAVVTNSYIVAFKDPIANYVPVGTQHIEEELTKTLGIKGKVISVFEIINAAHVIVSEGDLARLNADPRIKYIEQDKVIHLDDTVTPAPLIAPMPLTLDDQSPRFQNGVLSIPAVDTGEEISKYSGVTFMPNPDGSWKLNAFKQSGVNSVLAPISSVTVIKSNSQPVQVYLRIKGEFTNGCGKLGRVDIRLINNVFNIRLNDVHDYGKQMICTQAIKPFVKDIAMPVFELKAGTYNYTINGKNYGNFTLTIDNTLPNN